MRDPFGLTVAGGYRHIAIGSHRLFTHERPQLVRALINPAIMLSTNQKTGVLLIATGGHHLEKVSAAVRDVNQPRVRRQRSDRPHRLRPKVRFATTSQTLPTRFALRNGNTRSPYLMEQANQISVRGNREGGMLQQSLTPTVADRTQPLHRTMAGEVQFGGILNRQNHGGRLTSPPHPAAMGPLNLIGRDLGIVQKPIGGLQIAPVFALLRQRTIRGIRHSGCDRNDSFERRRSPKSMPSNCSVAQRAPGAQTLCVMSEPPVRSDFVSQFTRTTVRCIGYNHRRTTTCG